MAEEKSQADLLSEGLGGALAFKILVIWANFGEFGDFGIDFKILKKVCDALLPHIGTNFGKFWLSNFGEIAKLW